MASPALNEHILYEPDERPPFLLTLGLSFQTIMGMLAAVAAFVAITVRMGDQPDSYMSWATFAAFAVSGMVMVFHSLRIWRFGAGYTLTTGPSSAFILICATALLEGGPALMSSLIIVSTVFQLVLTARLSLLRRFITPTVAGTTLVLVAASAMFAVFGTLSDTVAGAPAGAAPIAGALTLAIALGLRLYAPPSWQQWTPLIALGIGGVAATVLGLYDFQGVLDAPLVGVPEYAWPGMDLSLNAAFWALLPGFVIVNLVASINGVGEGIAVQRVSWRRPRATDFRVIQGALNAVGLGNVLAAFLGTVPVAVYPANAPRTVLTGVAARRLGAIGGIMLVGMSLLPKVMEFLAAIPSSVLVGYLTVVLGLMFVEGMRTVFQDGLDARKAAVVGVSFWIGMGFQYDLIFPDLLTGTWATLLGNGVTTGSVVVILLTLLVELPANRRRRLRVSLDSRSIPEIDEFARTFADDLGWDEDSTDRLRSVGEETLSSLLMSVSDEDSDGRSLTVTAHVSDGAVELEFLAASHGDNLEDRMAYVSEQTEIPNEQDVSFRLLRHYASSVQHRKYHDIDIVTVRVEGR